MAESHTIKRAIIMAAGIGKRMQPLTLKIPKPLIKVNGVSMIDTVIEALHKNGITEIYVVVGHLKELFYEWAKKWEDVTIIENPYYKTCNNISSLYVAREYLRECMVLDGDQIIYNSEILSPKHTLSGYNAVWREDETDEWLMTVKDGIVISCSRKGGQRGWQLFSVSRWTTADGKKLKQHLEQEFENGNRQIYWDDVAMFCHFQDYTLGIREMKDSDITEIDNLYELANIDHSYRQYIK